VGGFRMPRTVHRRQGARMMDESREWSLSERVERLEREMEEFRRQVRHAPRAVESGVPEGELHEAQRPPREVAVQPSVAGSGPGSGGDRDFSGLTAPEGGERRFRLPLDTRGLGDLRSGEWWLNKLGIGLLLFGVAFLFVYSVERGWIGPWMRVGFGAAIGTGLLAVGLRVYERRPAFSQVLLGGGVGAFYITGFAAFHLYSLLPYPVALGCMVAVTLLAFSLSLRQDGVPLSLTGALGGLGTPFLLHTDSGSLGGLLLYTCLILAGMGAVYFRKGWVSLLAVSFVGGWMVLLIGYADAFFSFAGPSPGDRRVLQAGVAFAWLLFWLVPVVREILNAQDGRRASTHLFVVTAALVSFGFTAAVWELAAFDLGWIALSMVALYALAALVLRRLEGCFEDLSYTHALVALLFLTLAAILMLRGDALLLTLAAEAAVLHYIARRFSDNLVSAGAHLLFVAAAAWLVVRLVAGTPVGSSGVTEPAVFNTRAVVDLLVIGLAFAGSLVVMPRGLSMVYRVAAHAAVLAWLWRELSPLPGGEAYVTVAWGVYAVGLLVTGLRLDRSATVREGMATLFLVAGKLFLVDLAEVEALWRVLLFVGFGVLFLSLSYYLQALWRPEHSSAQEPGRREGI
jgi:uncharacterized membrane protein